MVMPLVMETPVTKMTFRDSAGIGGRVHLKRGRRRSENATIDVEIGKQAKLKKMRDVFWTQCLSIGDARTAIEDGDEVFAEMRK